MDGKSISGQHSIYVSAMIDKNTGDVIVKLVNASDNPVSKIIALSGANKFSSVATLTLLKSNTAGDVNSFAKPDAVSPVTSATPVKGNKIAAVLPANSFSVYRIGMK